MNWLILSWHLTLGLVSGGYNFYDAPSPHEYLFPSSTITSELGLQALIMEHIKMETFIKSYEVPNWPESLAFFPFRADFGISASILFGPFELKLSHECDHVVCCNTRSYYPQFGSSVTSLEFTIKSERHFH